MRIALALLALALGPAAGASSFEDVERAGFARVALAQRLMSADLTAESLEEAALSPDDRGGRRDCAELDGFACRSRCRMVESECMRSCPSSYGCRNRCWEAGISCQDACRRGSRRRCASRAAYLTPASSGDPANRDCIRRAGAACGPRCGLEEGRCLAGCADESCRASCRDGRVTCGAACRAEARRRCEAP